MSNFRSDNPIATILCAHAVNALTFLILSNLQTNFLIELTKYIEAVRG